MRQKRAEKRYLCHTVHRDAATGKSHNNQSGLYRWQFRNLSPRHPCRKRKQVVGDGAASSWLAGGTDLLVGIRLGARDPARVIDLKQIPELTAIEIDGRFCAHRRGGIGF